MSILTKSYLFTNLFLSMLIFVIAIAIILLVGGGFAPAIQIARNKRYSGRR